MPELGMLPVFCYGTLLCPEVLDAVLGRVPEAIPANLPGYGRRAISGRCYPAVVASPSERVDGRVLLDLRPVELAVLDRFEDPAYDRAVVHVELEPPLGVLRARVYARPCGDQADLVGNWSLEQFRASSAFDPYVAACRRFGERHREDAD